MFEKLNDKRKENDSDRLEFDLDLINIAQKEAERMAAAQVLDGQTASLLKDYKYVGVSVKLKNSIKYTSRTETVLPSMKMCYGNMKIKNQQHYSVSSYSTDDCLKFYTDHSMFKKHGFGIALTQDSEFIYSVLIYAIEKIDSSSSESDTDSDFDNVHNKIVNLINKFKNQENDKLSLVD